jgi:hypothetical protein
MDRLNPEDRPRVVEAINAHCGKVLTDRPAFEADRSRPFAPRLEDGLEASLSVCAIDDRLRVILTADDDPIFGQFLVTLLRLVSREEEESAYRSVAETLYGGDSVVGQD